MKQGAISTTIQPFPGKNGRYATMLMVKPAVNAKMTQQGNQPADLPGAAVVALYRIARRIGICRHAKIPGIPELAVNTGAAGVDSSVNRGIAASIHRGTVKGF
jgi:hypothetical protein